jgi:putative transposase
MKTLSNSNSEYQDKIRNIKNPAELAEILAPLLAAVEQAGGMRGKRKLLPSPSVEVLPAQDTTTYRHVSSRELEDQIVDLYAKGLTTRDITNHLKATHGVELSTSAISAITDKVFPLVKEWQARPLSAQYPILYLDALWFKVRDAGKIVSKCAYIALGINEQGYKEVLGIWVAESEGAKFWLQVLTEIKNRGVESVLIACVDGLKGFPDAIKTVFPEAEVQTCIVHQVRHTLKFVSHKDRKQFAESLKAIYGAPTETAGLQALDDAIRKWPQYSISLQRWQDRWQDLAPFFSYPEAIRRIMYTTNAIENLNRQFRKVTKTTQVFPHDDSLIKLLWLAQEDLARTWTMAAHNWGQILTQFTILFPEKVRIDN